MAGDDDIINNLHIKVVRLEEKLESANASLILARESIEHRLSGMNEFIMALKDQSANFVTRTELLMTEVAIIAIAIFVSKLFVK